MEKWQVVAAVFGCVLALIAAICRVLQVRAYHGKAEAYAKRAEEAAGEESEARKLSGRFPNLERQVLNLRHGFYRPDPQAVVPADELPNELEMNPNDLDEVLQDLRSSGHIVPMKHANHRGVAV